MIRVPAYELTIGTQRWTTQALELDVRLYCAPVPDALVARFPAGAALDASPGDDVKLRLDGGDGAADVFSGDLDGTERLLDVTAAYAINAGGLLARTRPAVTVEQATSATVIRALCDEAGRCRLPRRRRPARVLRGRSHPDRMGARRPGRRLGGRSPAWTPTARSGRWSCNRARPTSPSVTAATCWRRAPRRATRRRHVRRRGRDRRRGGRRCGCAATRHRLLRRQSAGRTGRGLGVDLRAGPADDRHGAQGGRGPGGPLWRGRPPVAAGRAPAAHAPAGKRPRDDAPAGRIPSGRFIVESVHHVVTPRVVRTRAHLAEAGRGGRRRGRLARCGRRSAGAMSARTVVTRRGAGACDR